MVTIKKYSTFEDLKSTKDKSVDLNISMQRHNKFEKFIKSIKITFQSPK